MNNTKRQNRAKVSIIDLLPLILTILLLITTIAISLILFSHTPITAIVLCIIGLIFNYIAGILIHEAGHIFTAKRYKMQVIYVNLGIMSIDLIEHKITPFTFLKKDAGEARFLPTQAVDGDQIKKIALGGLILSIVYFIIAVFAGILITSITKSPIAFCLFTVGQISNYYILSVNALSTDKTADGNIAFSNGNYPQVIAACANIERAISMGEIPKEPQVIIADNQPITLYYHYLFTAINNGRAAAFDVLPDDLDLNSLNDMEYALLFPEVLYKACIQNNLSEEIKTLSENYFATEPNGVSVIRSHYQYRKSIGDEQWSTILKGSYEKLLAKEPPFTKLVESVLNVQ